MLDASLAKNLVPEDVADLAKTRQLREFLASYGATAFLLVRLDDPTGELESGLAALRTAQNSRGQAELNVLGFHTVVANARDLPMAVASDERVDAGVGELRRRLSQGRHFAITLDKREHDGSYMDRISIGRARNKDVVLRDRSVSKFHAWFERGAAGALLLADAGSKNGTSVNGDQTVPRELANVKAGDVVRFGSVEAVICTPDALWRAAQPR